MTEFPAPPAVFRAVPAATPASLRFADVWRYWGRGRNRWAVLQGVELQIAPGSAVCVRGRNGAGKTTLLRIATGMLRPDRGRVTIDGMTSEHSWREYHRAIGFLSAGDRGLYARFSVRAHLDYAARIGFLARSERRAAVEEMIARFGLHDIARRRADRLSQGQRQRLRLAVALVHRPRVLLLDEPRNSLDDEGVAMLRAAVDAVLGAGGAVLWCCPVGEEQPMRFDRTLWLDGGHISPAPA